MHEAKSRLSKLVEALEMGQENEITIARNGRPVARLVPLLAAPDSTPRIGVAQGKFSVPSPNRELDQAVETMFAAESPETGRRD